MKNTYLTFLLLFLFAFTANAQKTITLVAPTLELSKDQKSVSVDIKVEDFENVSGMQFTVRWNPEILQFEEIEKNGLNYMADEKNFGTKSVDQGLLTFYWVDESLEGTDVADGYTIFSFRAKVIGSMDSNTTIDFVNTPTAIEISDPDYNVFDVEVRKGIVSVGVLSNTKDLTKPDNFSITPNPFKEKTSIQFEIKNKSEVETKIYALDGKIIFEKVNKYGAGLQQIQISKNAFPAAGIYLLSIKTEEFQVSEKLFFVKD